MNMCTAIGVILGQLDVLFIVNSNFVHLMDFCTFIKAYIWKTLSMLAKEHDNKACQLNLEWRETVNGWVNDWINDNYKLEWRLFIFAVVGMELWMAYCPGFSHINLHKCLSGLGGVSLISQLLIQYI